MVGTVALGAILERLEDAAAVSIVKELLMSAGESSFPGIALACRRLSEKVS